MINRLTEVVSELKRNWVRALDPAQIEQVCRDSGLRWRERVLSPLHTVQLLLLQILQGNPSLRHVRMFSDLRFSASAYCQARSRLPVTVLQQLLQKMSVGIKRTNTQCALWHGRRAYIVDGSHFSMSDTTELRRHFGQHSEQKEGCGFPIAHFIALVHVGTGMITEILSGGIFSHDLSRFIKLHSGLRKKDVVVGDRAFCSYAHLALILQRGVDAVFRIHERHIVSFKAGRAYSATKKGFPRSRWEKKLGIKDQLVTWFKPKTCPRWMNKGQYKLLPASLPLREVAYSTRKPGFRARYVKLVSTLVDEKEFPAEVLASLYQQRWTIETNFRHLKTTMGMEVLNCHTVDGVLKEFYAFCIVYNLVRTVMLNAAEAQHVAHDRISFTDALCSLLAACCGYSHKRILQISPRPGRTEPRAVKRRPKQYPRLTKPRKLYANLRVYA
jgi:hypothetical protein